MKKLLFFVIIGWMSVLTMQVNAQVVAFSGGYAFELNQGVNPNRTTFALDYFENHGAFGFGTKFPSSYDGRFEINLHGGMGFYWDNFLLSPQVEVAYNSGHGMSIGAGLLACYKIVGPLGAFMKIRYMSPVGFDPLKVGPGGMTDLSFGLTMFWFR